MAMCIIAYIRDSWNGSPSGEMHAFVAAAPAFAFQRMTASPVGAATAPEERAATRAVAVNKLVLAFIAFLPVFLVKIGARTPSGSAR
jgi:hypothetical protein